MGLDIYVGALSRYYSRQWETVVQQMGREMGMNVTVIHANPVDDAITDPQELLNIVHHWRKDLAQRLPPERADELSWNESFEAPYYTDKPAWDCFDALRIAAAHQEHPSWRKVKNVPAELASDRSYRKSLKRGGAGRYAQLLLGVEMWLPFTSNLIFEAETPAGQQSLIGSTTALQNQLNALNRSLWQMDSAQLDAVRRADGQQSDPLDIKARFAFSIMKSLVDRAVADHMPMLLDY